MKITYKWLKDFVDIRLSPWALADKLTMAGLEVTGLEEKEGDFIFELEITSNRPDCLSVVGIAREVAAITSRKLKLPKIVQGLQPTVRRGPSTTGHRQLSLKIENKKDCPLYTARIMTGVRVDSSPSWLKKRLELIDCRSINNIVDITNYIMFEWGQPLHAFDLDKLSSPAIIVRRGKTNETITTLDDQQRVLNPNILVIADIDRPVAVAGVMGGKDTEVGADTKNVLLEAAVFNPVLIRRAKRILVVQSESAYRFERCMNLASTDIIAEKASCLIRDIAGGRQISRKATKITLPKKKKIILGIDRVISVLGAPIKKNTIEKILENLGLIINAKRKNSLVITVPPHRADINVQEDLIEEIGRIFGYGKIPASLPRVHPAIATLDTGRVVSLLKQTLVNLGLNEVVTYSLSGKEALQYFSDKNELIEIANPLSREQEVLRPTVLPSLLKCIANNLNQKQPYVNIFEVTRGFFHKESRIIEEPLLGIALCGTRPLLLEQGLVKDEEGFLHLKGILEALFGRLGIKEISFSGSENLQEVAVYCGNEKIGIMIRASRDIWEIADIKNKEAYAAEIHLDKVLSRVDMTKHFLPLPLYPAITRDISIVIRQEVKIKDILEAIKEKAQPLLQEARVIDYYKGKHIPQGCRGITISCIYRCKDRTLTEEEVNPAHSAASSVLTDKFGAQIR